MAKPVTVHIISHTHWDREWFLRAALTSEWLPDFFESLFAMLEREPEYRFILDGQILMIEDWLAALKRQGKDPAGPLKKLKRYAREKRLALGPYYMQPDWQLASGESLIRNLLIGMQTARRLDGCMQVGWLLDNFGQISQTVQIHQGFGLEGLLVWRGIEMDPDEVRLEFLWESPDGSALPAVYLLDSYRNAMRLAAYPQLFARRIASAVERLKPFTATGHILLMNGYDQEIEPDDILPHVRAFQREGMSLVQSSPEELIGAVEQELPKLPKLRGVQYSGRFVSVFPGTLSSRMYLKIQNDRCQRVLEKLAEPLAVLHWLLGGGYGREKLRSLWKLLLQNHPHDNICGVCIDEVHTDMERRLQEVAAQAGRATEGVLSSLAQVVDTSRVDRGGEAYLVFNPSLAPAATIVAIPAPNGPARIAAGADLVFQKAADGRLLVPVRDIPALGYQTVYLTPAGQPATASTGAEVEAVRVDRVKRTVENRYLRVVVNGDGSLDVLDKLSGCTYRRLAVFEDGADAGDTYTYSPPLQDLSVSSSSRKAEIEFLETGPLRCMVELRFVLNLPEELARDRKSRGRRRKDLPIVTRISLEAGSPLLRFRTRLKNTVKDHRLRVLFPTNLDTGVSQAGSQFDVVEHEIAPQPFKAGPLPPSLQRILLGAREPDPGSIYPQRSFVDLSDGVRGVAVLSRGLPEYEVLRPNNTVALTLFRAVGWLARSDLLTRTGDAGPHIYTPDAQCLREMEFDYALYFHRGDWMKGQVPRQAEHFNTVFPVIETDPGPGTLCDRCGFLQLGSTGAVLQVSALKRSEDGKEFVLRCFNPGMKTVRGELTSRLGITAAAYADLQENAGKRIILTGGKRLRFSVGPKRIVTLRLDVRREALLNGRPAAVSRQIIASERLERAVDFSAYPSMPIATETDLKNEKRRIEAIAGRLERLRRDAGKKGKKLADARNPEKEKAEAGLQAEVATLERTLLEARLSLTLLEKKCRDLESGPDAEGDAAFANGHEARCREIGLKLNLARIKKRTYDYLLSLAQPWGDSG